MSAAGEYRDDGQAQPRLDGDVAHAPDVVEPLAGRIDEAVAQQRQRVREGQELGDRRQRSGMAPIGNSAPAKKNGRIATAGTAPM